MSNHPERAPNPHLTAAGQGQCQSLGAGAVHIIDDDEAVRRAIALLLQSAGIAARTHVSGVAFLDALPGLDVDTIGCILTDVRMPGLDGLTLLQRLREGGLMRPVIVMTAHGDIATAVRAMKCGAVDFVEKPFDDEELLRLVEAAVAGPDQGRAKPEDERKTMSHPAAEEAARRIAELSPREREVLELLTAGKANKIIAHELGISQRTAEIHRARMMMRLGVRSLAEAVRLAVRAELAGNPTEAVAPSE